MAKKRSHKHNEFLRGEVKRLTAELKRLKKSNNIDKDEFEYDFNGNNVDEEVIPCSHCRVGFMNKIDVVGRMFWKCSSCERTRKI